MTASRARRRVCQVAETYSAVLATGKASGPDKLVADGADGRAHESTLNGLAQLVPTADAETERPTTGGAGGRPDPGVDEQGQEQVARRLIRMSLLIGRYGRAT